MPGSPQVACPLAHSPPAARRRRVREDRRAHPFEDPLSSPTRRTTSRQETPVTYVDPETRARAAAYGHPFASEEVIAAGHDLAARVCRELRRAGLPAHVPGPQEPSRPGAAVEVELQGDHAGGLYVRWGGPGTGPGRAAGGGGTAGPGGAGVEALRRGRRAHVDGADRNPAAGRLLRRAGRGGRRPRRGRCVRPRRPAPVRPGPPTTRVRVRRAGRAPGAGAGCGRG